MEPRTHWSRSNAELRHQSMQLSWHQSPPQACDISLCTVNHLGFNKKLSKEHQYNQRWGRLSKSSPTGPKIAKVPQTSPMQSIQQKKKKISTALVPSQHSMPRHIEVPWLCVASWGCQIGRLQQDFNQLPRHILRCVKGPARVALSQCLEGFSLGVCVWTKNDWLGTC